jgi:hypothetical protein
MEQLHILDGDPPEDDLTPPLLGASHYLEVGDYLGLLECIALSAYQVGRVSTTSLLHPQEARVLAELEAFQLGELRLMHGAFKSSELATSAFFLDQSGVYACCRASEFRQQRRVMDLLRLVKVDGGWTQRHEWAAIQHCEKTIFQAAAVFVAWLHLRFQLHYLARDPTDNLIPGPADNGRLSPFIVRTFCPAPAPRVLRTRLAGWQCTQADGLATYAAMLAVPAMRDPANMINSLKAAVASREGPFFRKPAAAKGVLITELTFGNGGEDD